MARTNWLVRTLCGPMLSVGAVISLAACSNPISSSPHKESFSARVVQVESNVLESWVGVEAEEMVRLWGDADEVERGSQTTSYQYVIMAADALDAFQGRSSDSGSSSGKFDGDFMAAMRDSMNKSCFVTFFVNAADRVADVTVSKFESAPDCDESLFALAPEK